MRTLIRILSKITRGVRQQVNSENVTDFIVEVSREVASPVSEQPDALLMVLSIILAVAIAFTAKAAILTIWKRIRNHRRSEVDSPQEANRG